MSLSKRIEREKYTVGVMISMYCNHQHNKDNHLCNDCTSLNKFAIERINKCIFHENKPVCSECQVHCYHKEMREQVKSVMRFAGPRMLFFHPILGIRHLIDKRRFKYINPKLYKAIRSK